MQILLIFFILIKRKRCDIYTVFKLILQASDYFQPNFEILQSTHHDGKATQTDSRSQTYRDSQKSWAFMQLLWYQT